MYRLVSVKETQHRYKLALVSKDSLSPLVEPNLETLSELLVFWTLSVALYSTN
jgi:hypothetical protein